MPHFLLNEKFNSRQYLKTVYTFTDYQCLEIGSGSGSDKLAELEEPCTKISF